MPNGSSCHICSNTEGNRIHKVREMMFGTREPFEYLECASCGCLQIVEIPANLAAYYPPNYHAFKPLRHVGRGRAFFRRLWAGHHLVRPNPLGYLLTRRYGEADFFEWAKRSGISFTSNILDVGSGNGRRLVEMSTCGFVNLTGVDPFVESDIDHPRGVRILKRDVASLDGQYDLVMSHHSFEHVPNPLEFLKDLRRLLKPNGTLLIRTPSASSWAWEHYGTDWVALDAPRHLFVHTTKSMRILAEQAGLTVTDVVCDSNALSIWGSEQYRRDIPLRDESSYAENPDKSIFSKSDLQEFKRRVGILNAEGRGDSAAFYLKRVV